MTDWRAAYQRWLDKPDLDQDMKEQLHALAGQEDELEDCFHKYLEFGTGGIRGVLGPGTNRLNLYTIHRTAEGLARWIDDDGDAARDRGVAIAYDGRYRSRDFAFDVAMTLGYHGIRSYVFASLRPTPELSFAVRHLHAAAGVMITASHNPPEYNGLKVYGPDGGQIISETADAIVRKVNAVEDELAVQTVNKETLSDSGLLQMIDEDIDEAYLSQLQTVAENPDVIQKAATDLGIVYTPLHGAGLPLVKDSLQMMGFKHVYTVAEQAEPDPEFSTVASPNPEEHAAFELAIRDGDRYDADILIGTDPDADRMGVAAKNRDGLYQVLTGDEVGALMLHYLLTQKRQKDELPANAAVIKTIVTSELGRAIASAHGIETIDTLTGFKYIAEQIETFHETKSQQFLLGYEESYGYLIHDFVRDKDAVQASMLIAEIAGYYKLQGMTLHEALMALFAAYGYYQEDLASLKMTGQTGSSRIDAIMETFRSHPPETVAGKRVLASEDYQTNLRHDLLKGETARITLPKANVLKYKLDNDAWFCLRPSGTEPKIKFYFGVKETSLETSHDVLQQLKDDVLGMAKDASS
ncbi:phospho-sugar mutase [Barrientosiimonas marina]|uniref:Phosphoglucomutase n=1 Tax=Lentibacillus kimchii TaxID=1542911 RepID=A0ABW2UUV7_9BACI